MIVSMNIICKLQFTKKKCFHINMSTYNTKISKVRDLSSPWHVDTDYKIKLCLKQQEQHSRSIDHFKSIHNRITKFVSKAYSMWSMHIY